MSTLLQLGLSGYDLKPRFCALNSNANISYKIHFFFVENFLVTLDTYAKKVNPFSIVLGGGGHGKVCWLIAYNNNNNNIYLKFNIHKSSIDYKYIHMYNKIMLYT